ncbi:MAG TPA: hypothetical protein DCS93_07695 [Microscillaceae bacterium]|nr:hypothetical protein [Microscillaceae bacterium]
MQQLFYKAGTSKLSLALCSTLFCVLSACSDQKNAPPETDQIAETSTKRQSIDSAFIQLRDYYREFDPKEVLDYPSTEWSKIYVDEEKRLVNEEAKRLLKANIEQYNNPQDSLITFVKKSDLLRASIYPVGRLNYSQKQKVTILLSFLKTETKAFTQKHYLLSYFSSVSGQPLGYDLLAGVVNHTAAYYGRWGIRNQQIWINRFGLKKPGGNFKAQKYKVAFNQTLVKQPRASEERLFTLLGTPKNIQGVKYRFHSDVKAGYSIGFPYEVFTYSARTAAKGVSEDFVSKDQQAYLTFYRTYSIKTTFVDQQGQVDWKKYFNSHKQAASTNGSQLTYSHFGKNYFVLSGIRKDGRIFYEKHQDNIHFSLVYPKAQKTTYDGIVAHLVQTFRVK